MPEDRPVRRLQQMADNPWRMPFPQRQVAILGAANKVVNYASANHRGTVLRLLQQPPRSAQHQMQQCGLRSKQSEMQNRRNRQRAEPLPPSERATPILLPRLIRVPMVDLRDCARGFGTRYPASRQTGASPGGRQAWICYKLCAIVISGATCGNVSDSKDAAFRLSQQP